MSVDAHISPTSTADVLAALADLARPFAPAGFVPDAVVVHPDAMPTPADDLLVHHSHMTVVLQKHYGRPVAVRVLCEQLVGQTYTRKIALTLEGTNRVVEWGIARLNLLCLPPQFAEEILAKGSPLGAILIRHDVHRRVKPRYFLRFPAPGRTVDLYDPRYNGGPVYGRLATIYCDGDPAIELLEIVVDTEARDTP